MEKQIHLAAQYLAAAAISFIDKREDDSHTNFGFDTDNGTLSTHVFSENKDRLVLNYQKFTLDWISLSDNISFRLDGATHQQIIKWISKISQKFLNKIYEYKFHYNLPYPIYDDFIFKLNNIGKFHDLMHLRIFTQFALERILIDNSFKSPIRIWPHHFDTGVYEQLPNSDISIGLGLAIPDDICDEHYLYVSGYKGGKNIETSNFQKLEIGEWRNETFKGAIIPAKTLIESEAVQFFQGAINNYKNIKTK